MRKQQNLETMKKELKKNLLIAQEKLARGT